MTQFNPENKEKLTWAEALDPAMKITDEQDAIQYKAAYIAYLKRTVDEEDRGTEEAMANSNLGFWAGNYDHATMERVNKLFTCTHPWFG